ncbi:MAG: hypothetical protein RL441_1402 [Actinomycetota bacterium]|jgi:uncharacterized membrane protein YqgA involved in biofilm formation
MVGLGTVLNIIGIAGGGAIGAIAGHRMREDSRVLTTDLLGLVTGLSAALSVKAVLSDKLSAAVGTTWPLFIVLAALLIGASIGSLLRIEARLELFGETLKNRFAKEDGGFVEGFLSASLIFCIGPLAIMGAFDDALGVGIDKLVLKTVLDFFASIAFAASLGWGVAASAIAVGIYQGALTVLGLVLGSIWDAAQIDAMTAVGGLLLMAISLKLLNIKHIAIGNVLPALFVAPVIVQLIVAFS